MRLCRVKPSLYRVCLRYEDREGLEVNRSLCCSYKQDDRAGRK